MNNKNSTQSGNRQTNSFAFFRGFLREPGIVGSVIPSSRFLEQRIMQAADFGSTRLIVEFGPGTGGTTRAFLNHMPRDALLLTIEISPAFVGLLNKIQDSRLINHCGSAADLEDILNSHGLPRPDVVISGIPFSTMPTTLSETIIRNMWASLVAGGRFIAYQFRNHVAECARPLIGEPEIQIELRNIPPMRVFRWTKGLNGHSVDVLQT